MWLKKFIRKYNIHLIILLFAVFIWIHVKTELSYDQIFNVTVVPTNINPEYIITNKYTPEVPIRFQGKGKNLIALRNTDLELLVDLSQTSKSTYIATLNLKNIRISPPIVNILPIEFTENDTIIFSLSPLRYKKVVIEHQIDIKPQAGFMQVGAIQLSPSEITVSGPENLIRSIQSVKTDPLALEDLTHDVVSVISLENQFSGTVVFSSQQVEYSVDIQQIYVKEFSYIPVQVINVPATFRVSSVPSNLSLKITGGIDNLSNLKKEDISAYIDFRRYDRDSKPELPAMIKIPAYMTFSDVQPEVFRIKIDTLK
jgi:YbbR domain-containing protein